MDQVSKKTLQAKPKTVFVIDSVRSDRIYLAKFIKHEGFMVMSFNSIQDCFKNNNPLHPDLIIITLRKKAQDLKKLNHIKRKLKDVCLILQLTKDVPDINTAELQEQDFSTIYKAANPEKTREIAYELLSPETLPRRKETPHPVPYNIASIPNKN